MTRTGLVQSPTSLTQRGDVGSSPSSNGSRSPEEKVHGRDLTRTAWSALRTFGNAVAQLFPTLPVYDPAPTQDPSQVEVKILSAEELAQNQEIQTLAEELGEPIAEVAEGLQQDLDSEEFTKAVNTIVRAFHEQRLDDIFTDSEKRKKYAKIVTNIMEKNTRQSAHQLYSCSKLYEMPHHYMFLKETKPEYKRPDLTNRFVNRLGKELEEVAKRTPKLSSIVNNEMNELLRLRMGEQTGIGDIQAHYDLLVRTSVEIT